MAEGAGAEIIVARTFEGEIESVHSLAVDVSLIAIEVPFVGPQKVAPTGIGTFYNKINVIDCAIVVAVEVVLGGNGRIVVDVIDGTNEQVEFALAAFAIIGVAEGIAFGPRHIVCTGMRILIGENAVAIWCRCIVGVDEKLVV